jgi:hypothetical protein
MVHARFLAPLMKARGFEMTPLEKGRVESNSLQIGTN